MSTLLSKELEVSKAEAALLSLENYYTSLVESGKVTLDIALESEMLVGNPSILHNHFSSMPATKQKNYAMESTMEAIVAAFKAFLAHIVDLYRRMIAWFNGEGIPGFKVKNPLRAVVVQKYQDLPGFNYDEETRVFGLIRDNALTRLLDENEKDWIDRVKPLQFDLITGGGCYKAIVECANGLVREQAVPKYKIAYQETQTWEEKMFDKAIELDTELIKRPREEANERREEFRTMVSESTEKELVKFDPVLEALQLRHQAVIDCRGELPEVPQTALRDLQIDPNVLSARFNSMKVLEFSRLQKDQARTLEWAIQSLTKVQSETAHGEGVLQQCFQAMRMGYTKQLSKLVAGGRVIQESFVAIGVGFEQLVESEIFFVNYQLSRIQILIGADKSQAQDWKAIRESWHDRKADLQEIASLY
jgi:hypothetical protein